MFVLCETLLTWFPLVGIKKGDCFCFQVQPPIWKRTPLRGCFQKTHLRLRCNCNITNRNIIVIIGDYGLWTSVEPSSFNRTLCSPINKLCQSHKSFFQFFLICNFFFFAEVLWGFILPPAVSLSRILWELAFLLRKEPPLRIAKKSLIVSWWSWWESHPCLKSYWTTCSLSLLRESIRLYLVCCGVWKHLGQTSTPL